MIEADREARHRRAVPRVRPLAAAREAQITHGSEILEGEHRELRNVIQELRRKTTLMAAELYGMDEVRAARDDASLQLEEARAEIVASNDRRKEMARVIADRNAKIETLHLQLEEARSKILASNDRREQMACVIADRNAKIEALSLQIKEARSKILASNDRRGEMARVIANRDAKIEALNRTNELRDTELKNISAQLRSREQEFKARCDKLEARLQDTKSKLVASQARRKEMALVIDRRGAAITDSQRQVESAQKQVATLERHVRTSITWWLTKKKQ